MRHLLWLVVLLLPLAAAQDGVADENATVPEGEEPMDDVVVLQVASATLALVLIGAFVYFARR